MCGRMLLLIPKPPSEEFSASIQTVLENTYYVPDTLLDAGDRAMDKSSWSIQFQ